MASYGMTLLLPHDAQLYGHTRQPRPFLGLSFTLFIWGWKNLPAKIPRVSFLQVLSYPGNLATGSIGSWYLGLSLACTLDSPVYTANWHSYPHSFYWVISRDVFLVLPFIFSFQIPRSSLVSDFLFQREWYFVFVYFYQSNCIVQSGTL